MHASECSSQPPCEHHPLVFPSVMEVVGAFYPGGGEGFSAQLQWEWKVLPVVQDFCNGVTESQSGWDTIPGRGKEAVLHKSTRKMPGPRLRLHALAPVPATTQQLQEAPSLSETGQERPEGLAAALWGDEVLFPRPANFS